MPVEATGRNALSQVQGGNRNNPLSQRCAKIIAFGTSSNKGEDFQGVSVLLVRDPSGYSKQMQMMRLVPDTTGCQHDLESETEMLQIEGKLVLHCPARPRGVLARLCAKRS
jgi:hypothetical protein